LKIEVNIAVYYAGILMALGRVTGLARPSVCSYGLITWKQKGVYIESSKLVGTFPSAGVSGVPISSSKCQRSISPGVKNHQKMTPQYLSRVNACLWLRAVSDRGVASQRQPIAQVIL